MLDGDTKNSTFADIFKKEHPERFIECFIAEQNMVRVLWVYLLGLLIDSGLLDTGGQPRITVFLSVYKSKGTGRKNGSEEASRE